MKIAKRVSLFARLSLVFALLVAFLGWYLKSVSLFWGGLILAFGEAALVGGLADWFAVRALFGHPFGIPFPHSAIIPRNRVRIVAQLRDLVQNEWLSREMLHEKLANYDFVNEGIRPLLDSQRDSLRPLLATVSRHVLQGMDPDEIAGFLSRSAGRVIETDEVAPFLANLAQRAHQEAWLDPLLQQWMEKLELWAGSEECRTRIHLHLEQALIRYRNRGMMQNFSVNVATLLGGLDMETATTTIQAQIQRFAQEEMTHQGKVRQIIREGLSDFEQRIRDDDDFLKSTRDYLRETSEHGTLHTLLQGVVTSLRGEALEETTNPDSPLMSWCVTRVEAWLENASSNEQSQAQINQWCRDLGTKVIDKHQPLIGRLVEEQLNRLSDENLTDLIQDRVGEDLNWIRINGAFVGGIIGVIIYLFFHWIS